jgi:hypothetical protein
MILSIPASPHDRRVAVFIALRPKAKSQTAGRRAASAQEPIRVIKLYRPGADVDRTARNVAVAVVTEHRAASPRRSRRPVSSVSGYMAGNSSTRPGARMMISRAPPEKEAPGLAPAHRWRFRCGRPQRNQAIAVPRASSRPGPEGDFLCRFYSGARPCVLPPRLLPPAGRLRRSTASLSEARICTAKPLPR